MSIDGLLLVDKPAGWTSHDVVARTRRLAGTRRVGHAGTLDPMATGLLLLGINRATKLLTFLVGCDKTYTATIRLGQATITDDAEGEVTAESSALDLTDESIQAAVAELTGPIQQVPSSVSAIKVNGERAYAKVRGGDEVFLQPRPITVHRFEIGTITRRPDVAGGVVDIDAVVEVSSGTYVRALARDLGAALGVGGHLTALRRTRVGRYCVEQALGMEALSALRDSDQELPILPMADAAREQFPVRELGADHARTLRYGQKLASAAPFEQVVAAIGPDDDLVAILDQTAPTAKSLVVFPPA